jgi:hypothetical protein
MDTLKSSLLRKFLESFCEIYRNVYMWMALQKRILLKTLTFSALLGFSILSYAIDITGWTCDGSCGTLGADGVVTLPPSGQPYGWIASTESSPTGLAPASITVLTGSGSTTGSRIRSPLFSATSGEELAFYYNYVSSDGAGFADYAWVRLVDQNNNEVAILFTARTTPTGNTVPGANMPLPVATLNPPNAPIIPGGPAWSPLGGSSGTCYSAGCGYTGWVSATYSIPATGNFYLEIGVVNWNDSAYQSGLAFDGVTVGGDPIGPAAAAIPTLQEWALLLMGLLLGGLVWRSARRNGRMAG